MVCSDSNLLSEAMHVIQYLISRDDFFQVKSNSLFRLKFTFLRFNL